MKLMAFTGLSYGNVNKAAVNHLSDADWSVQQQARCGVGQRKVLNQELLEN